LPSSVRLKADGDAGRGTGDESVLAESTIGPWDPLYGIIDPSAARSTRRRKNTRKRPTVDKPVEAISTSQRPPASSTRSASPRMSGHPFGRPSPREKRACTTAVPGSSSHAMPALSPAAGNRCRLPTSATPAGCTGRPRLNTWTSRMIAAKP
jgi:hypothetical protein